MAKTSFGFETTDDLAREIDDLLKEEGTEYTVIDKVYNPGDYFIPGEHADVSVISDDSVDRDGEVLEIKSMDWSSFRKNPIVLFAHKSTETPVGKSVWQHLYEDKLWKAKTVYAKRPENFPVEKEWFPDTVFDLIKNGFLLGKSVGGVCKKMAISQQDLQTYPHWNKAKTVIKNVKVYEYSVVPCQSNNNAVVEVVSKGLVTMEEETIKSKFPEVYELYKDISSQRSAKPPVITEPEVPIIKNFRTQQEYNNELVAQYRKEIMGIYNSIPEIVENVLAKMLGRV